MSETKNKSINQQIAEEEVEDFREDLGPFVVAAETTRMAMVFTNAKEPDHPIIFANESFLTLSGYDQQEVLGRSFNALIAQDANPDALARLELAFKHSANHDTEIWAPGVRMAARTGPPFSSARFAMRPVMSSSIFPHLWISPKHKREQVQLRLLIDELNHRVKNTLSTVQSIIAQAFRRSSTGVIRESIESRRLRAFAVARSAKSRKLGRRRPVRFDQCGNAAVQPRRWAHRAPRDRGPGYSLSAQNPTLALGIAFLRTGYERRQTRCALQCGRINLDRLDDRSRPLGATG